MALEEDLDRCSHGDLKHMVLRLIRQLDEQERRINEQAARIEEQAKCIAELEARLNEPPKNSGNSSVPPAQGFKGNKKKTDQQGKAERTGPRRGSLGRKGHHRPLAVNPDEIVRVMAKVCVGCGHALGGADQRLHHAYDKVDIPQVKPHVTRVEIYEGVCPCCAHANEPQAVPEGLEEGSPFSLNIVALAIYLCFIHAISYERLARLFRDRFGLGVSEGGLNAMLQRAKPCFDQQVEAILSRLRKTRVICSDETSVRIDGVNWWNWVFQNDGIVLHVIRRSRGHGVVEEVLAGHRPALWVSDLYGAQQGHAEEWQICLAHQLRDCRYAIEAGDTVFAPRMKHLLLRAFVVAKRRHELAEATRKTYKARLEREMDKIMALSVEHKDARRLRKRYGKHRGSLFTFLDHPEIAPDNNSSERALRPTATYRKVTGGFRSNWGADLYAAVRSIVGTGTKQGLDAFAAIKSALGISVGYAAG
jgi:transposase